MKSVIFVNSFFWKNLFDTFNYNFFFHFIFLSYKDRLYFNAQRKRHNIILRVFEKKYISFLPELNSIFFFLFTEKTFLLFFSSYHSFLEIVQQVFNFRNLKYNLLVLGHKNHNRLFSRRNVQVSELLISNVFYLYYMFFYSSFLFVEKEE